MAMVSVPLSRLLVVPPALVLGVTGPAAAQTPNRIGEINAPSGPGGLLKNSLLRRPRRK
jgi:hypothetical protein